MCVLSEGCDAGVCGRDVCGDDDDMCDIGVGVYDLTVGIDVEVGDVCDVCDVGERIGQVKERGEMCVEH